MFKKGMSFVKKNIVLLLAALFMILLISLSYSALTIKTLNAPTNASWHNTSTIKFDFTPMNNDTNSSIINCTLFGDFTGTWVAVAGNSTTILNGTSNNITYTPPTNGTFLWNIQCVNNASHTNYSLVLNSNLGNRTIYIDQGIDVVNINLTDNNTFTSDVTPNINITFVDNMALNINYTLFVNGVMNVTNNIANDTRTEITFTELNNGTYLIIAMAKDNASNVRNSTPLTINVDNHAPNVTNMTLPANNSIQTKRSVEFNFTPYDNLDPTLTYELFINDTTNTTGATTINNSAINFSMSIADGKYNYAIMLTDTAGNKRNSSGYNFTVVCVEAWTCTTWGTCSSSTQSRNCTDAGACGTTVERPDTSQSCVVSSGSSGSSSSITKTTLGTTAQTVTMDMTDKTLFTVNKETHYAQIKRIYKDDGYVTVTVRSGNPIDVDLYLGKTAKVDVDDDGTYDISLTLEELYTTSAKINFEPIEEAVPPEATEEEAKVMIEDTEEEVIEDTPEEEEEEPTSKAWIFWLAAIVIVVLAVLSFKYQQKK